MLRILVGCVAGVFIAGGFVAIFEALNTMLHPMPAGLDPKDTAAIAIYVNEASMLAKTLLVLGWALAALIGGSVAAWVSSRGWASWVVAGFMLAGVVFNMIAIPHPLWMIFATIAGLLFAAVIGAKAADLAAKPPLA